MKYAWKRMHASLFSKDTNRLAGCGCKVLKQEIVEVKKSRARVT
jgi:hypothetical protein